MSAMVVTPVIVTVMTSHIFSACLTMVIDPMIAAMVATDLAAFVSDVIAPMFKTAYHALVMAVVPSFDTLVITMICAVVTTGLGPAFHVPFCTMPLHAIRMRLAVFHRLSLRTLGIGATFGLLRFGGHTGKRKYCHAYAAHQAVFRLTRHSYSPHHMR